MAKKINLIVEDGSSTIKSLPIEIFSTEDDPLNKDIGMWQKSSKRYDPRIDLEKVHDAKKRQKIAMARLRMTKKGKIRIRSRNRKVIDLSEYYSNPDEYYDNIYYFIHNIANYDIINEDARENYVIFTYPNSDKEYKMSVIHFVYNMIMWMPYFILKIKINKKNTFMPKVFNNHEYEKFINTKIIEPYRPLTTHNQMSQMLAMMYDLFQRLSELCGLSLGFSFSNYDIIMKWKNNPELKEINHTKIPERYQISEMEQFLTKQANRAREIIMNDDDPNDSIKSYLRSGQLNKKQFREYYVSIGTKPDLRGNTYPHKPSPGSNFLVNGLKGDKGSNMMIDAFGSRKVAILNQNIDDGGYVQRAFGKSTNDILLNPDPNFDCGSENYYYFTIRDERDLKKMEGRYFFDPATKHNKQIIASDTEYIGETLAFRSPATCAGGKKGICRYCYGNLYNQNLGTHVGIFSALKLAERNYQLLLSAKHILDTTTGSIEFNEEFNNFFDLEEGCKIIIREDLEELDSYEIWINVNSIHRDTKVKGREHDIHIPSFVIYDKDTKNQVTIVDKNESDLYIANQLLPIIENKIRMKDYTTKGIMKINLSDLNIEKDIFHIILKNNEITESLSNLKNFIEKGRLLGIDTVTELINTVKGYMEKGQINEPSVHIEILCRNLIRSAHNRTKLPDWTIKNPEYIITSIHNSIFWSGSVINSITFEHVKLQLRDPLTYRKRETSFLDPCFIL